MDKEEISKIDFLFIFLYSITLILGIWHAFPHVNVSHDESPYVWGVLEALTTHSFPNLDVMYTISFYASYFLMGIVLLLLFRGDVVSLESSLRLAPWKFFLLPRFITIISAGILLFLFLRLARLHAIPLFHRLGVAALIFTNVLFVGIAHTGKMWLLSLTLFFISFFFLAETIRRFKELPHLSWYVNPVSYSIIFAFLATANFPFNAITLFNVGYIWFLLYRHPRHLSSVHMIIVLSTALGVLLFLFFFDINQHGWLRQSFDVTSDVSLTVFPLFFWRFLFKGALSIMPLLLIPLCLTAEIREKRLFWFAIFYLISLLLLYTVLVGYAGSSPELFWRYLLYPVFLVGLILLFVTLKHRAVFYVCILISFIFFLKTLYLLTEPTTYNQMLTGVNSVAFGERSLLINRVPEWSLWERSNTTQNLLYIEVTPARDINHTLLNQITTASTSDLVPPKSYLLTNEVVKDSELLYKTNNGSSDDRYYASIDDNLGPYDYRYLFLERLGRPLYLYNVHLQ